MTAQSYLTRLQSDGIHLGVKELLQYRQFANLLDLTPRRTPQARLAGSYLTKHKGRGMEFDEARHYQPGDDIRAIDWRVTARWVPWPTAQQSLFTPRTSLLRR